MTENIPKKSLGQHWLNDERVLASICDAAQVSATDTVLEVGPGLGTLTKQLLQRADHIVAVEFDDALAAQLRARVSSESNSVRDKLEIISQDILSFDLTTLPAGYKVVANIPYYLTSNLIRVLCESSNPFSSAAILIQKEVAERVAAEPGQMSILSVSAQYYCEVSLGPVVVSYSPPRLKSIAKF